MSLVALYYYCAVSRSTPGPFSVSASASAESLPASTAGDVCPGVGVAHGRSSATPSWARPLCLHDICPALYLLLEARDLLASSTALYMSPLKRFGWVPGVLGGAASAGRVGAKYI